MQARRSPSMEPRRPVSMQTCKHEGMHVFRHAFPTTLQAKPDGQASLGHSTTCESPQRTDYPCALNREDVGLQMEKGPALPALGVS